MKNRKRIHMEFAFYDRTGIESFLEKQAAKGWIMESVNGYVWRFVRTEPKQLRFCVTFFPEIINLDSGPSAKFVEFLEYCKCSGWQFVDTLSTMQIFYSDSQSAVPIETDALLELETIHKSVKESYLNYRVVSMVGSFILLCLSVFSLACFPHTADEMVVRIMHSLSALLYTVCSSIECIQYYQWKKKAQKEAEMYGAFTGTKSQIFMNYFLNILYVFSVAMYVYIDSGDLPMTAVLFGIVAVFVMSAVVLTSFFKGKKKDKVIQKVKEDLGMF